MTMTTTQGIEAATSLRAITAEQAPLSEANRTLTQVQVDSLWASGLMTWANPAEAGGAEPSFAELIETWIELAWQDGSLGWIGIANLPSAAAAAAYLPDEGFAEVFGGPSHHTTIGGQFFPMGWARWSTAATRSVGRGTSVRAPGTPSTWPQASCPPAMASS